MIPLLALHGGEETTAKIGGKLALFDSKIESGTYPDAGVDGVLLLRRLGYCVGQEGLVDEEVDGGLVNGDGAELLFSRRRLHQVGGGKVAEDVLNADSIIFVNLSDWENERN